MSGGAIGSLCRFLVSDFIASKNSSNFPLGTFVVNIFGSLLIGFLFGLFSINGELDKTVKFLVFIGFLGGFTTFSSFALESVGLFNAGYFSTSLMYILLSNFIGIALALAGFYIATKFLI